MESGRCVSLKTGTNLCWNYPHCTDNSCKSDSTAGVPRVSNSVAYLKKRLTAVGRFDLLEAADAGQISTYAAAEESNGGRNSGPGAATKRASAPWR